MQKLATIVMLSAVLLTANVVHAEIASLSATNTYSSSQKPFYEDGVISVDALKAGCAFSDATSKALPALPPECVGYFRAVAGLFHSGGIKYLMSKEQCFDLSAEIPDWSSPIILSFAHHAKGKHVNDFDALPFIIQAVVKDYPCDHADADAQPTRGVLLQSLQ